MNVLLTVGNGMMGDDGAGVLLAQIFQEHPLENWTVLNGGSVPENILHKLREIDAGCVLVVDAADMDLPPGSIRRIRVDGLIDPFLMTTHTLPLTFLVEAIQEFVPQVDLVGIQPNIVAFGFPMSTEVRAAVQQMVADIRNNSMNWNFCN